MERAAASDKQALTNLRAEEATLTSAKATLEQALAEANAEKDALALKVSNHGAVAVEVAAVLRAREERIDELEALVATTARDVKRLCRLHDQDKTFIDHLQRVIGSRNADISKGKEDLALATSSAKEHSRRAKRADAEATKLRATAEQLRTSLDIANRTLTRRDEDSDEDDFADAGDSSSAGGSSVSHHHNHHHHQYQQQQEKLALLEEQLAEAKAQLLAGRPGASKVLVAVGTQTS